MNNAEKVRVAELAKNLWLVRHGQYVFVEDVAISNMLKAPQSRLKAPSLKKIGRFVYKCEYFNENTFIPSMLDIFNNLPKRYSLDCFLKRAHAFSVQKKRTKKEGDHFETPLTVTLYGIRGKAAPPEELKEQPISVFGKKFTQEELEKMEQFV